MKKFLFNTFMTVGIIFIMFVIIAEFYVGIHHREETEVCEALDGIAIVDYNQNIICIDKAVLKSP